MSVFTNPAAGSPAHAEAYISAILDVLGDRDPLIVLERTPDALATSLRGLSEQQLREPEAPGKWALTHVLQHLADSEVVWGWRLRMVLAHDRPRLEGYDQDVWAARLRYDQADAEQALHDFAVLRRANLRLLGRMTEDDLARVGIHAERGEESVSHMMRLYAGHDLVHRRQVERIVARLTNAGGA